MVVGVYLDPRKASFTSKSAENGFYEAFVVTAGGNNSWTRTSTTASSVERVSAGPTPHSGFT